MKAPVEMRLAFCSEVDQGFPACRAVDGQARIVIWLASGLAHVWGIGSTPGRCGFKTINNARECASPPPCPSFHIEARPSVATAGSSATCRMLVHSQRLIAQPGDVPLAVEI